MACSQACLLLISRDPIVGLHIIHGDAQVLHDEFEPSFVRHDLSKTSPTQEPKRAIQKHEPADRLEPVLWSRVVVLGPAFQRQPIPELEEEVLRKSDLKYR
jgi:hypothetical protein